MNVRVEVKNYKLLKDLTGEFSSGNVYLVRAGNGKGKTTFCRVWKTLLTAENNVTKPVTFGEEDGKITAMISNFQGIEGNNFKVVFNFTDEKETFTLITPDTKSIKNKTEIRNLFKYNSFTVDEFFSWGKSAEGRRKQAGYLFKLLPEAIKEEMSAIDSLTNEKNGTLFIKRKDSNASWEALKGAVERGAATAEEEDIIGKEAYTREAIVNYEAIIKEIDDKITDNKEAHTTLKNLRDLHSGMDTMMELSKARRTQIQAIIAEELDERSKKMVSVEDLTKAKFDSNEKLIRARAYLEKVISAKSKKETHLKDKIALQKEFDEKERLTAELEKQRQRKKDLFAQANIDPRVTLVNDELFFLDGENTIPFDDDSVSYSAAGLIVAEFVIRLNQTTPIIMLGQASEYGKVAMDKLALLAKQHDCIIFADRVEFEDVPIHIEVYERTTGSA